MTSVSDIQSKVDGYHTDFTAAAADAPPSALHWKPDESAWSAAQILAHVAEFERFFSEDVRRLKAKPGSRFGRTVEHEQRLQAVALTGQETMEELLRRIGESHQYVSTVLAELSDADLGIEGVNPKFGTKTVEWVIGHFIVDHLKKHVGQLRRTLQAYQTA